MSSTIIDETVILRYLLDDDEVLSPRAAKVIATRTARVYPEIITRVVVTLRDVYKVPRVEIAAAMKRLLDDVMVDEPTVVALAIKLFGKTHMDFTDCLLAARTAIYNDDVVSFGKPIIQGMIDYRRKRQTAAEARSRSIDSTIDKLRHRPRSKPHPLLSCGAGSISVTRHTYENGSVPKRKQSHSSILWSGRREVQGFAKQILVALRAFGPCVLRWKMLTHFLSSAPWRVRFPSPGA